MPKQTQKKRKYHNYKKESFGKSVFDGSPTLVRHKYIPPNTYRKAISEVIIAYKNDTPFNTAVDIVADRYPKVINRNKLAEHTLKTIANDY